MFIINDGTFVSLFGAATLLGTLFILLRTLRMPENFSESQLKRNELRKQLIRNELLLSQEISSLEGDEDQVS